MDIVTIRNHTPDGTPLEATYFPGKGMNMVSFKWGGIELIDQSTKTLFDERFAGLGALIGPHFHVRRPEILPTIKDESLFPHIARVKARGTQDPFSHGIGRYAPWKAEMTESSIRAGLTGKDLWNGVALAELEGQNFKMTYQAAMHPDGLHIEASVVSDSDSVIGFHYYYYLPDGKGKVVAAVQDHYIDKGVTKKIPAEWMGSDPHLLMFPMEQEADYTFSPYPNPLEGRIELITDTYRLRISYDCASQENAWQLWHPKGASFVCIEPVSAQDPRHPNLTVSSLKVHLSLVSNKD